MQYDIAIIGGGITGCMTAYKLSRRRLSVAVCEAGGDVASGCTRANSAIIHAGYDPLPSTLKAELNVKGCAEMPVLCRNLNVKFKQTGSLVAAFSEQEMDTVKALFERGKNNGVSGLEIIGAEKLREMEPNIAENALGALWAPTAGIVCPYGLCIAVAETAAVNGVDFLFDYKVDRIVREKDVFCLASSGGKTIYARYIVNAAGAYADEIAAIAGEKDFPAAITPRRGEYMLMDKSEGGAANRPIFTVPSKAGKGILITPTADGNLIIGPNAHAVPSPLDTGTTAEGMAEIQRSASKIVKKLNTRAVITSFAGVRPTPACDDFYIKPSEQIEGLLHIAGIESPGLASSPAVGEYAVELLGQMGIKLEEKAGFTDARPEQIRFSELDDDQKRELVKNNPAYGRIICRCEGITEGEILDAIRRPLGAKSLDAVKRRTRAGMGRCQGGFCSPRVTAILARELNVEMDAVTKNGGESYILTGGKR